MACWRLNPTAVVVLQNASRDPSSKSSRQPTLPPEYNAFRADMRSASFGNRSVSVDTAIVLAVCHARPLDEQLQLQ